MAYPDATRASSARRKPLVAAALSGVFPGLGQLYNRDRLKALLFLGGDVNSALERQAGLRDPWFLRGV